MKLIQYLYFLARGGLLNLTVVKCSGLSLKVWAITPEIAFLLLAIVITDY